MNVLLLSPIPPPNGGIARWSETVINYCNNNGIHLHHIDTGSKTKDMINRSFFQRFVVQFFRIFLIINEISKIISDNHISIVHITTSGDYGVLRDLLITNYLQKRKVKYVYHLHFGQFQALKEKNNVRYRIMKRIISKASTTITMDPNTKNALAEEKNVVFIPNPIHEIEYSYSAKNNVVYLGNVIETKGIGELITAWAIVHSIHPEWKLRIVGSYEKEYRRKLEGIFKDDSIIYVGEVKHDVAIGELANASIMVLPSYSEGFPYSICEAMFSGKAIIATNVGSIPYMLSEGSGVLCKAHDSDALAEKMIMVMNDKGLREDLGLRASNRARLLFKEDIVMKNYIEIWRKS